jgi:hypothetical protein
MSNSQSASLAEKESGFRSVGLRASGTPDQSSALTNSSMRLSTGSPHASSVEEAQVATERPLNGRRMFRFTRFSLAVLIGVGATLGWQSYGDEAREIIIEQVPTLASLLGVSKMKSPVVATTSPELVQQLIPVTFSLDVMRRSVDQLAAKQEQMAQNIAALQAVDEDVRQKVSSPPPSPTQQAAPVEQAKPPQPKAQALQHSRSAPRPPSAGTGTGFVSR